jgi:L-iditol 2-dehydrogenase
VPAPPRLRHHDQRRDGVLGGWADRIEIRPGVRLLPLPDGVDPASFMGGGCGLGTGLHAVERAGITLGDTVVVQGSGPVGLNAAVFAALSGAAAVLMIGAPAARLEIARALGVDDTLDLAAAPDAAARASWVRARTAGRGADVVIEATGNPQAVRKGSRCCATRGRYVVVGQYTDAGDTAINPHRHLNRRHATVLGCWGYEFSHFHRAIALLARHDRRLGWRRLVTREYPLERAGEALAAMAALDVVKAVVRP